MLNILEEKKIAQNHIQLLENRIARLKFEEDRTKKRIEETKKHSEMALRTRERRIKELAEREKLKQKKKELEVVNREKVVAFKKQNSSRIHELREQIYIENARTKKQIDLDVAEGLHEMQKKVDSKFAKKCSKTRAQFAEMRMQEERRREAVQVREMELVDQYAQRLEGQRKLAEILAMAAQHPFS